MLSKEQKKLDQLKTKPVDKPPYSNPWYFDQVKEKQLKSVANFIDEYGGTNSVFGFFFALACLGFICILAAILSSAFSAGAVFDALVVFLVAGLLILPFIIFCVIGSRRWFLLFKSNREISATKYAAVATLREKEAVFDQLFKAQKLTNMITDKQYALLLLQYLDGVVKEKLKRDRSVEIVEQEKLVAEYKAAKGCALSHVQKNTKKHAENTDDV